MPLQGSYLLSNANAPIRYEADDARKAVICFQPLTQQSVTKRAMPALRNGRCPRYETGETRDRKRIRRFSPVVFSRLPSYFVACVLGHLRQAA